MRYYAKAPDGPAYEFGLDELRQLERDGKAHGWLVRRTDDLTWYPLSQLVQGGELPRAQPVIVPDHPVAFVLVIVFRLLGALSAILVVVSAISALKAVSKTGPVGIVPWFMTVLPGLTMVAVLLGFAEILRLGMAVEKNTRGGEQKRTKSDTTPERAD